MGRSNKNKVEVGEDNKFIDETKEEDEELEEAEQESDYILFWERICLGLTLLIVLITISYALFEKEEYEKRYYSMYNYESSAEQGYVTIERTREDLGIIIVSVEYNGEDSKYNCYIDDTNIEHNILFTSGDGEYQVSIYVKEESGEIEILESETYSVGGIDDSQELFNMASYNVEYEKYEEELMSVIEEEKWGTKTEPEVIKEYFEEFSYNKELENEINSGEYVYYNTDVGKTLENKKGICTDIASAMACVYRELGLQARVVVAQGSGSGYHSWCEVRIENEEGEMEWVNMDTLKSTEVDKEMKVMQIF